MNYEILYRRVRFESFVKLADIRKDSVWTGATIRYNGNDICGEVQIDFGLGVSSRDKEEFKKIANDTLKLF